MATANYYNTFELQPDATESDIKRRYRQLSFQHHPDRGGSADKMMLINEAYSVLSNNVLRREYDRRYTAQQSITRDVYNHSARKQSDYYAQPPVRSEQQSRAWIWIGVMSMILFGFLAYQLHSVILPAASTGNDLPMVRGDGPSRSDQRQIRSSDVSAPLR